jgi:membrane fusion protein
MNISPSNLNSQSNLFRKAAVDSQKSAWLGHPKLIQPISVLTATIMALAIMGLIGGFLFWGEYTRRVRVYGSVVPSSGVIQVLAPQTGRVYRNFSGDDQPVKAGMPLFTLRSDITTGFGETEFVVKQQLQGRIADLQETINRRTDLAQVEKTGLSDRLLSVNEEIERIETQLEQTTAYVAVLLPRVEKYRALVDRGVTTERNFEIAEQAYMQSRQELESLRRQRVQLGGNMVEIQTKLNGFDASVSIEVAELRQRISTLKEQLAQAEARREIIITAPANGSIAATLAHSGQPVAVGAPLISILPEGGDMEIHFLADSKVACPHRVIRLEC